MLKILKEYKIIKDDKEFKMLMSFAALIPGKKAPLIIKENVKTNEIYFYRDKGVTWKNEQFKLTDINKKEHKDIPQEPFSYFEFPSRFKFGRKPIRNYGR